MTSEKESRVTDDCEIGFDPALVIEHLRVDDRAVGLAHVVRGDLRKDRLRVGAGQAELRERGLIEQRRRLSRCAMLPSDGVEPVRPLICVTILGDFAVLREPVGAFPTKLFAEYRARRRQSVVERRAAQRPSGAIFLRRPSHAVMFRVGLERARADPVGIEMATSEPPDVRRPEVERRRAFYDPFGERHSRAAPGCDAEGVEARADEDVAHLRRLAEDEIAVRREALRPVDHLLDADVAQSGHAPQSLLHDRFEMIPIRLQKLELEILRQWVGQPGPRIRARNRPSPGRRPLPSSRSAGPDRVASAGSASRRRPPR